MAWIRPWVGGRGVPGGRAEIPAICVGRRSIHIATGLLVVDRLLPNFKPVLGGVSVFSTAPVLPAELLPYWTLNVYDPDTCPRQLDPKEGALVVTNYHQLLRTREDTE